MLEEHAHPWGLSRMAPLSPASPASYRTVHLDPVTQQAVYVGQDGQPIEAGRHGTNKQTSKAQTTGGSDGQTPTPPDETTVTDYDND
jgi:putative ATP-grasp target RiPP